MKRVMTAALVLILTSGAMAQTSPGGGGMGNSANPSVPPSLTPDRRPVGSAPVGHRQPRPNSATDADAIDKIDPADLELDRKIKGICRGC